MLMYLWWTASALFTFGAFHIAATVATIVFGAVYIGYSAQNGVNDVTGLAVMLLTWDRVFGPSSVLMRRIGRRLGKLQDEAEHEIAG